MAITYGVFQRLRRFLLGSATRKGAETPETPPNLCTKCRLPVFFETLIGRQLSLETTSEPELTKEDSEAIEYGKLVKLSEGME